MKYKKPKHSGIIKEVTLRCPECKNTFLVITRRGVGEGQRNDGSEFSENRSDVNELE
jgi:hypothetical protein